MFPTDQEETKSSIFNLIILKLRKNLIQVF